MEMVKKSLSALLLPALCGCPGVIDNPAAFEVTEGSSSEDQSTGPDGGVQVGPLDALGDSPPPGEDAGELRGAEGSDRWEQPDEWSDDADASAEAVAGGREGAERESATGGGGDASAPVQARGRSDAGETDWSADAESESEEPDSVALRCDFPALMQAKCGSAGCHGAPALATGLDLTSPGLAERVGGRRGASCPDSLLVDPDQPEQSALYLSVVGSSCGVRMPIGASLSLDEQQCILQWLENL